MRPLRLEHGQHYVSYGFVIGPPNAAFVYLSDLSRVLPHADSVLRALEVIDLLIIDCLFPEVNSEKKERRKEGKREGRKEKMMMMARATSLSHRLIGIHCICLYNFSFIIGSFA